MGRCNLCSSPLFSSFFAGVLGLATAGQAFSAVIYVRPDVAGANDGTGWADAYGDLQAALAAANPGDEIWVAAGRYTPSDIAPPGRGTPR